MFRKFVLAALIIFMIAGVADAVQTSAITSYAKELMMQGFFKQSDTYKIAFYTSSRTCDATETVYTTTNEITGTNYSAGGYTLTGPVVALSGTTAYWDFTDVSQSTVTFNSASTCAIVYDATDHHADCTASGAPYACCTGSGAGANCNAIAAVFTLTFSSIQPSAGTLSVTWPAADASNAIVRVQ